MADNPVPPIPDDSNLPITSNPPPQSPTGAAMAQMQSGQQPQANNRPPVPMPIIAQLISGLRNPPPSAPDAMGVQRPGSRLNVFENFLGNFITALGSGMAAAHGPGAFGKGFGAAAAAPYEQDVRRFQLGQQAQLNQADIQQKQAQTQLEQGQAGMYSQTVMTPYGPMNQALAAKVFPAAISAQGKVQAAGITAQAKLLATAMTNPSLPLDPTLAQAAGHPEWAGQAIGKAQLAALTSEINTKTKLVGTARTGEQIREDADGNLIKIPVTSTSRPNLPIGPTSQSSAPQSGTPSGFPRATGGGKGYKIVGQGKTPSMVTGTSPDGKPIAGTPSELRAANATGVTQLPAAEVSKVVVARQLTSPGGLFDLAEKDLAQFKTGELEGLAPRWNEFLAGKVGTADPRYIALRTHVNGLLGTALMQAHVGSRGGEMLMEHFEDIANAGKMSKDTLSAALNAEKGYVQEKAMRPAAASVGTSGVTSLLKKHGF